MIRWGIFSFYDEQGIAGKYLTYYLDCLHQFLDRLIIVCNCGLENETEEMFHKYTDEIIIRQNMGGDAGAYKQVILHYLGQKEILEIDELILFNDTMFGPVIDLEPVLHKMEVSHVQFWGITQNDDVYLPSHIQSYFIGIKKELLHHKIFMEFWQNLNVETNDMKIIVCNFEIGLTVYFQNAGFLWETLAGKTEEYLYTAPSFFLRERGLPFLKKKSFGLHGMSQEELEKVSCFIKNNTAYPMELIYGEINRKYKENVFRGYCLCSGKEKMKRSGNNLGTVLKFVEPYKKILIFGTTVYGICLAGLLSDKRVEYVVSDGYDAGHPVNGTKVNKLSEVKEDGESCMVITAQSEKIRNIINWEKVIYYW